jgi:site-specific DNA-methyltransferase (adenine-specific)
MACAIEDAGWDIRDTLMWVYGSGFPKSKNIADGFGTALKPAWEPIIMARKPLDGTVQANWDKHGTGVLNIDGCRIGTEGARNNGRAAGTNGIYGHIGSTEPVDYGKGRWPANIIHDGSDEVLAAFPNAAGQMADASENADAHKTQNVYGAMRRGRGSEPSADSDNNGAVGFAMKPGARRLDSGSAARFFYCAKASRKDRNAGMDGEPANHHPTVKPTELMRWLVRLVTPPGGTVLDPFAGSGSTGRAAAIEGMDAILIELNPEYAAIARKRIHGDAPLLAEVSA